MPLSLTSLTTKLVYIIYCSINNIRLLVVYKLLKTKDVKVLYFKHIAHAHISTINGQLNC